MDITVRVERGVPGRPGVERLRRVVARVLEAERVTENAEVSLLVTTQEEVHRLNRIHRHKDHPTDVLSFYMTEGPPADFVTPPEGLRHLGEVIISYPQAVIQARERRHSIRREMAILTVHGVLHLLGYDHEEDDDAARMEARERAILGEIEA